MTNETVKATCTIVKEDVLDMFELTEDEAEEWLLNNRKHIELAMCRSGFEAILTLGEMDDLKEKEEAQ